MHRGNTAMKEWRAVVLKYPMLAHFACFDIGFLTIIIVLAILGSRNNGFATVPDQTRDPEDDNPSHTLSMPILYWSFNLDLGILWTALPAAVLQLFAAWWAAIAAALALRQPFVELWRTNVDDNNIRCGTPASKTILLDYAFTPSAWRWLRALRLGHTTVGATALTALALQFIAAPLGARLCATRLVPYDIPRVRVDYPFTFNFSAVTSIEDWRPILENVQATLVAGAAGERWTTDDFAFRPFSVYTKDGLPLSGNDVIGPGAYDLRANTTAHGAMVFIAGRYPDTPTDLANFKAISCATAYRDFTGVLEVSVVPRKSAAFGADVTVRQFTAANEIDTSTESRNLGAMILEHKILTPVVFNALADFEMSQFAGLVMQLAKKENPDNQIEPGVLINAIGRAFGGAYAIAVALHGFEDLSTPDTATDGIARQPVTRLFVVDWVAWVLVGLLSVALILTGWVAAYVARTRSILTEEPQGLLALATILEESDVMHLVPDVRQLPEYTGKVRKLAAKQPGIADSRWGAEIDFANGGVWRVKRKYS
ncbi:hypothetical protein VTJ04DRAFT_10797 [Mycothermus thermophilus]|uniref:uncharacterized protein n=1 Tax=Humicola insolens TaxID=85995 RepID=UPI0037435483